MNKKIFGYAAVFTLCCTLLLSGCAAWNLQTKQSDPNAEALPVIETIPWAAHQTASYVIYNSKGNEYGTAEIEITVDTAAQTYNIQKTKSYEDETVIESGVTIAMDTLMPLSSYYNKVAPYEKFEVSTKYSDRWEVETTGAKSSSQTVSLPDAYYDNESLMVILGTVSYEDGKTYKLNDTVPLTASISMLKIKYEGTETISVPYGEAECFKVSFGETTLWFSTDTRILYQYQDGGSGGIVFKLTDYTAS
ncbi:hypothetical protein HMPREF1986_00132 [Oribacterium sp. oral taxon 078 str. F0263]|uniref:DUF3108 domain-containing protein n=1 Tax=Oribacterium sp. oral taxon 078 TaxID=652706 RepID=UPI0003AD9AAB|nr:DUF3108 domain-containing protein [Oribacterium sp. oral taxon 078]ERL22956.1 hypothetical protein HMPREF1986_00132 [Oribacterium sp. oral taxon 078 str. F0263]